MIIRDEGLALIELQRVGRPANQLNVILRRYWMQITDQQLLAEDAPRVFAEIVLPQCAYRQRYFCRRSFWLATPLGSRMGNLYFQPDS